MQHYSPCNWNSVVKWHNGHLGNTKKHQIHFLPTGEYWIHLECDNVRDGLCKLHAFVYITRFCVHYTRFCTLHAFVYTSRFCIRYTLLCTLHSFVYTTRFCVHYTLLYTLHAFVYTTRFCVHFTLLYTLHAFVYTTRFCVNYTIFCTLHAFVHYTRLCTLHTILYTTHICVHYTRLCTLHMFVYATHAFDERAAPNAVKFTTYNNRASCRWTWRFAGLFKLLYTQHLLCHFQSLILATLFGYDFRIFATINGGYFLPKTHYQFSLTKSQCPLGGPKTCII
jgi:hypothetical protein